jgi:hypothetical protein
MGTTTMKYSNGFIQTLTEGARTPHPEDFIFQGSAQALAVVDAMTNAVSTPEKVTIKWDGSPAIVFGRRVADGMFTMNYKEYIGNPGGQVTSAQELLQYFQKNNKNMVVAEKLAKAFNAIGSICPPSFKGFVQGDLMWTDPGTDIQEHDGKFVFKANPHGVTYKVDVASPIGKQIAGRQIGLAVHSAGSDIQANADTPLVGRHTMNGLEGLTGSNQYVTVFTGNMNTKFKMKTPVKLVDAAKRAINNFAVAGGDEFLAGLTGSSKSTLQTYYNRKVSKQPVDGNWLQSKLTKPQFAVFAAKENKPIVQALDEVYSAITAVKLALLAELEPQVGGIEQWVTPGRDAAPIPKGEGFNIDSPMGFIKLVNRGEFSAGNFAGRT